MSNDNPSGWNQQHFDHGDRRRARDRGAARGEKAHDGLHLEVLHALVRQHFRHTDVLHAHEGGLVLTCA